jgi:hypothetical protein
MDCPECGAADFYASIFNGTKSCLNPDCDYGPKTKTKKPPYVEAAFYGDEEDECEESGTELERLCRQLDIEIEFEAGAHGPPPGAVMPPQQWRVTLRRINYGGNVRTLETDFFGGGKAPDPTVVDVLYCLVADAWGVTNVSSFEEWCNDLGYDSDSRKAEAVFKACEEQVDYVTDFLGEHFEDFAMSQH